MCVSKNLMIRLLNLILLSMLLWIIFMVEFRAAYIEYNLRTKRNTTINLIPQEKVNNCTSLPIMNLQWHDKYTGGFSLHELFTVKLHYILESIERKENSFCIGCAWWNAIKQQSVSIIAITLMDTKRVRSCLQSVHVLSATTFNDISIYSFTCRVANKTDCEHFR